jgi:hypothetical protein
MTQSHRGTEADLIWPDPVPCRPENPVQGIRQCQALRTGTLCPWLHVRYCGVRAGDMADALETLGLDEFDWLLEDDVDASDVETAADELADALNRKRRPSSTRLEDALVNVRWFVRLLRASSRFGCGLSNRFAERLDSKDRY